VAIQRKAEEIVRTRQDIVQTDTGKNTFIRLPKGRELVAYHWVSNPRNAHFMLLDDQSIGFYAFQERGFRLVHLRTCVVSVGHYWYEPESGTVLVASQPPRLGLMSCYFVHAEKNFEGEKFCIDVSPSVTNRWTTSQRLVRSLALKSPPTSEADPHRIFLTRLYNNTYLIHLHCLHGLASISVVTPETVHPLQDVMTVSPGVYDIRAVDNLLLFHNYQDQTSFLYDIMAKPLSQAFCTLWHSIPPRDTQISVRLFIDRDRVRYFPVLTVLYDGVAIASISAFRSFIEAAERENTIENEVRLDRSLNNIMEDVSLNVALGRGYRLVLEPEQLAKGCFSLIERVLFLLRRTDGKYVGLKYFLQGICLKPDIRLVAEVMDVLVRDYHSRAAFLPGDEGERRKSSDMGLDRMFRSYSIASQTDTKQKSAITQSEMHQEVLIPLYEERSLPIEYQISVILAYFRALDSNDLPLHPNLQLTMAQFLIRRGAFGRLVEMVAFHVLEDCFELAALLCALGQPALLQQGLDMMRRLECWEELLRTLLEKHLASEFLSLVQAKASIVSIDLLEAFVKQVPDSDLRAALARMSKQWSYGPF